MKEQVVKALGASKEFWSNQSKRNKILILSIVGVTIVLAIATAVMLNLSASKYKVLYPGISKEESLSVFEALQDMSVEARMTSAGEVQVPSDQVDRLMVELSAQGYPKTAPSWGVFASNSGFTTTEFEKKQYLIFNLEEKMNNTLKKIDGVRNADVTLVVPPESNYVWEQDSTKTTASVLLTMNQGAKLSPERVSSLQALIASGVPKLDPADVVIMDASTMLRMKSAEESQSGIAEELERLGLETEIERSLQEKVINVLSIGYTPDQLRVSASVVLDYDKMISEELTYNGDNDGKGVIDRYNESLAMSPSDVATGGIVGEEDNTDVPSYYVDENGDGTPDYANYQRDVNYLVSSIKKQVEKGGAVMKSASIAVTVADSDMKQQKKDALIDTVAKATNIPAQNISINNFSFDTPAAPAPGFDIATVLKNPVVILSASAFLFVALLAVILFAIIVKRKRNKAALAAAEAMSSVTEPMLMTSEEYIEEVSEQKRRLKESAEATMSRENMMTNEIKEFASQNPEITASLIRTWLKEDE